ncbi:hypothetical protein JCM10908_003892 [Rhodotorula pacifica]|uniref:bZIP transcription factor n=1 Tax=Rhodotorula pacifica TaxID=1495444 RepID=UPI0031774193
MDSLASPAPSVSSDYASSASSSSYPVTRTGRSKRSIDYAALDALEDVSVAASASPEAQQQQQQQQRPTKRRAPRSTAAEKQARKVARMERNRIAAQVSRDKKKQQQELLEARISELEGQLAHGGGNSGGTTLPSPPRAVATASQVVTVIDPQLKEENEALKTQLALEKLHSQSLQIRLAALESKFSRLEQLLSGGPSFLHGGVDVDLLLTPAATATTTTNSDFSPFEQLDLEYDLGNYCGANNGGLQLELDPPVVDGSELARDPSLDSSPLFGAAATVDDVAPVFSAADVDQAWFDWSLTAAAPAPPATAGDFDLVAFLADQDRQQQQQQQVVDAGVSAVVPLATDFAATAMAF